MPLHYFVKVVVKSTENKLLTMIRCFPVNTAEFLVALEKQLLQNYKGIILHNSIAVDMKAYALQLKQKFFTGISNGILRNIKTAIFENNFWGLRLKRKQRRKRTHSDPCGFKFSLFPWQLFIY